MTTHHQSASKKMDVPYVLDIAGNPQGFEGELLEPLVNDQWRRLKDVPSHFGERFNGL